MGKVFTRVIVAPLVAFALVCAGLATALAAPAQAHAETADKLAVSAVAQPVSVQASSSDKAKKAFAGKYTLVKMKDGGKVTGAKDLKALRALGLEVTLNLKKNGKATLNMFGEKVKGTWKATTAKRAKVNLDGSSIVMKKKGSKVTLTQQGASLTFKKK